MTIHSSENNKQSTMDSMAAMPPADEEPAEDTRAAEAEEVSLSSPGQGVPGRVPPLAKHEESDAIKAQKDEAEAPESMVCSKGVSLDDPELGDRDSLLLAMPGEETFASDDNGGSPAQPPTPAITMGHSDESRPRVEATSFPMVTTGHRREPHPGAEAVPGTETRSPTSLDPAFDPGTEATPATDGSNGTDQETSNMFQTEAQLVDRDLERARIEEEIRAGAPRAEVVDEAALTKHRRRWQLAYAGIIFLFAVALVLGLVFGLKLSTTSPETTSRPYNDDCVNAMQVEALPFSFSGETESADVVVSGALACPAIDAEYRGAWFQIAGSSSPGTCINASAVGIDFNAVLAAYQGPCDDLACFSQDADSQDPNQAGSSRSEVLLPSGRETYSLLVTGLQGSTGNYRLQISNYECLENDKCVSATPIKSLPFFASGNTILATAEGTGSAALQCPAVTPQSRGVYYELISSAGTCVTASMAGSDFDTLLAVYEGQSCGKLSCVGSRQDVGASSKISWSSQPGTSYQILVAGQDDSVGGYNLTVRENECYKCTDAIDVDEIPFVDVGSTDFASIVESSALQEKCSFIQSGDRGIWYSVTSASGHCMTVSTDGSDFGFDTALAVYEGGCKNLSCVAHNDNWKECQSCKESMITVNPHTAGKLYQVLLAGRTGSIGNYSLSITEEGCDRCPDAILVGALPFHDYGTTEFARTVEGIGQECLVVEKERTRGVWYRLDNLGTGRCMTASTTGSEMDTLLAVYKPEDHIHPCDTLKCLNSNNNIPPGTDDSEPRRSEIFWKSEVGRSIPSPIPADYFVMVGGHQGRTGKYELTISEYDCLENDDCSDAFVIQALPFAHSGTTLGATPESSDTLRCSRSTETTRGVFYEMLGTGSCVTASIETDYEDFIAVYKGECGDLNCVVQSTTDLICGDRPCAKRVAWQSQNGTRYRIFVAGFEDIVGDYNLTILECLEKDECITATQIEMLPFIDSDTIVEEATSTYWHSKACPAFTDSTGTYGRGFWYRLTGTGSCITASTAGSGINTVVGVYEGECDEDDLVCVTNNDDAMSSSSSLVTWPSTAGSTYRILVAGYGDEIGSYNLNITERPCVENDDCADASLVLALPYSDSGNTLTATTEGTAPIACNIRESHFKYSEKNQLFDSRGVWYEVGGGLASCFNASTTGSGFDATLAVYEGACRDLSCVAVGKAQVSWSSAGLQANYKVLVIGQEGEFGPFKLDITVC